MPLQDVGLQKICDLLKEKDSFIISTSSPDGDSVGSMLSLNHLLKMLGKKTYLYLEDPVSLFLKFLPEVDNVSSRLPNEEADCLIIVDTGHSSRFFGEKESFWRRIAKTIINIDHHQGCDSFGHVNLIDCSAAACGEILLGLFQAGNFKITREIAVTLLTSIIADTGGLKYSNVSPRTLRAASELVALGAEIYPIYRSLYSSRKLSSVRLLGQFFSSLKEDCNGKVVWGYLTRQMFEDSGASDEEGDKIVEELDVLEHVKVYCMFKESKEGSIKISLRSRNNLSVKSVAEQFGGGGHIQAAGCKIDGTLEFAMTKVLPAIRSLMECVI